MLITYVKWPQSCLSSESNRSQVGGELKIKSRALKWGAFLAVAIVTFLYTMVTMAYVSSIPMIPLFDDLN
jgi:hypothetical protein